MNKLTAIILIAILSLSMLSACASPDGISISIPQPKTPEVLSAETETLIKQTHLDNLKLQDRYPDATTDNVQIIHYYGTYNDAVAVMITDVFHDYTANLWHESVVNIRFYYGNGNHIKIWKDGVFYRLEAAYEQGILTKNDLRSIAYYQNNEK
ncbi:MAG: hypothetical protein FWH14_01165 [Oscillospiraceae bacterium]|nr:hypothetical protein [Oscillospiraceae bacterium]